MFEWSSLTDSLLDFFAKFDDADSNDWNPWFKVERRDSYAVFRGIPSILD